MDETVQGIPVTDPQWEKAGKTHDWRKHVGWRTQEIWPSLTTEQRLAIATDAQDAADREEWE